MKCKRKIGVLVVFAALMLVLLTACNKDYYGNAIFPQLETFTAITKIKVNEIEEDVTECVYSYLLSDDAEKDIERYQKYLTNSYEFQLDTSASSENYRRYKIDDVDDALKINISKEDYGTVVNITVPWCEDVKQTKKEEKYQEAKQLIEEEKFEEAAVAASEARDIHEDAKQLMYYCEGRLASKDPFCAYASAMDNFQKAGDVLDAKERLEKIRQEVSKYNGTYYCSSLRYSPRADAYLYIKDGKVDTQIPVENHPNRISYSQELMQVGLEKDAAMALGMAEDVADKIIEEHQYIKVNSIGHYYGPIGKYIGSEVDKDYMVVKNGDGFWVVTTGDFNTIEGLYKKVSDTAPEKSK